MPPSTVRVRFPDKVVDTISQVNIMDCLVELPTEIRN